MTAAGAPAGGSRRGENNNMFTSVAVWLSGAAAARFSPHWRKKKKVEITGNLAEKQC